MRITAVHKENCFRQNCFAICILFRSAVKWADSNFFLFLFFSSSDAESERGLPYMKSTKVLEFLTSSPLFTQIVYTLSPQIWGIFWPPPPSVRTSYMEAPKEGNTKIGGRKRLTEAENKTVSPAAPPNAQSNSDPLFKSFRCPCGIFEYVVFSRINLWNRGRNNEHQIFFEYCCISCTFLNLHSMRKHHPSILICTWFLFLCVPVPAYWGVGWAIFSKCRFLEDSAPQMWPDVTRCDQMWSDVTTLRNPRYLRSVALPTLLAHLPSLLPPPSEISLRQQRTDPACGPHFQWVWAGQGWGSLAAFTYLFRGVNTSKNLLGKNSFVKKFA